MEKAQLRDAILVQIKLEWETQTHAAMVSREEATHEESRAENQYDMHAQEAAYLAEGQARLAAELAGSISAYHSMPMPTLAPDDAICIGALVTLDHCGQPLFYFVGPRNGGLEISFNEIVVTVVTPASPLGRLLIGARRGQTVLLPSPRGKLPYRITAIC